MNEIMILLLKVIYRFDAVKARETPMTLLPEVGQKQSQWTWKHHNPQTAKAILKKKGTIVRDNKVPQFKS